MLWIYLLLDFVLAVVASACQFFIYGPPLKLFMMIAALALIVRAAIMRKWVQTLPLLGFILLVGFTFHFTERGSGFRFDPPEVPSY